VKILFVLGASAEEVGRGLPLSEIRNTAMMYAHYLKREFEQRGIEVVFAPCKEMTRDGDRILVPEEKYADFYATLDLPAVDHVLCLEQSGFYFRSADFLNAMRRCCRGGIATICDHDMRIGGEDFCFHARIGRSGSPKAVYVGWAADGDLFLPGQDADTLNVFIDHKYYHEREYDMTEVIIDRAQRFAQRFNRGEFATLTDKKSVRIWFLSPTGIVELPVDRPVDYDFENKARDEFTKRIAIEELAPYYRKSDIFLVTHSESMGMPVLEAALCGALVLAPRDFVHPELLRPLQHMEFDRHIPWDEALQRLDVVGARERALPFSWGRVADRMLAAFSKDHAERPAKPVAGAAARRHLVHDYRGAIYHCFGDWRSTFGCVRVDATTPTPAFLGARTQMIAIAPNGEAGDRYLVQRWSKLPLRESYSVSLLVRPRSPGRMTLWLFGASHKDSARCTVDFSQGAISGNEEHGDWTSLDCGLTEIESGMFWCFLSARSDYAPVLGTIIQFHDFPASAPGAIADVGGIRIEPNIVPMGLVV